MAPHLTWLVSVIGALQVVRPVQAELCSADAAQQVPVQAIGKFGQALSITGELATTTFLLSQWKRYIKDQDGNTVTRIVVSFSTGILWPGNVTSPDYTATLTSKDGAAAFKFQFQRLACHDRGLYECSFLTVSDACVVKFNVNLTADPLPPVLRNDSIRGDVGSTVSVLCEANVGYPAGTILWYHFPADGSNGYRLSSDAPELESAGDCRLYAKSTLKRQLTAEDHNSKIRCTSRTEKGRTVDFAEVTIFINGFEQTTEPTPKPCVGNQCSSTSGVAETPAPARLSVLAVGFIVLKLTGFVSRS